MERRLIIHRRLRISPVSHRIDLLWILIFGVAGLLLLLFQLDTPPLRDWDEGIVAQVARQIWRSHPAALTWVFPQVVDGSPYWNKPPLMHWLITLAYFLGGVNEWTSRLPGALLTAISVPLLYWLGRELFYQRLPAILAAGVYLTSLPVVRQGRLAMLDGAILCCLIWTIGCALRSRRNVRWSLGIGLGIGLMCLTKGLLGLLLGMIGIGFLVWDTPRLLGCGYLWSGLVLGLAPAIGWYGAQWWHYGSAFGQAHLLSQGLNRVWTPVEQASHPPWYYLWELIKNGVPWLVFVPSALRLLWQSRNLSWARLLMLWLGGYFGIISLMVTKLPWYAMPLYPALALLVGAQLAYLWDPPDAVLALNNPQGQYRPWALPLGVLAIAAGIAASFYLKIDPTTPALSLKMITQAIVVILGMFAFTLLAAAVLAWYHNRQFIVVLIWGTYLTLLLFVGSPHWVWELAEDYQVQPVAELVQNHTPLGRPVYTSHPTYRPSLEFYSNRRVIPMPLVWLNQELGRNPEAFVLVRSNVVDQLPQGRPVARIIDWAILRGQPRPLKQVGGATTKHSGGTRGSMSSKAGV
jgi:4-amino-4-deoxy-L-arabinose transferase-like glycosyltransferase